MNVPLRSENSGSLSPAARIASRIAGIPECRFSTSCVISSREMSVGFLVGRLSRPRASTVFPPKMPPGLTHSILFEYTTRRTGVPIA